MLHNVQRHKTYCVTNRTVHKMKPSKNVKHKSKSHPKRPPNKILIYLMYKLCIIMYKVEQCSAK